MRRRDRRRINAPAAPRVVISSSGMPGREEITDAGRVVILLCAVIGMAVYFESARHAAPYCWVSCLEGTCMTGSWKRRVRAPRKATCYYQKHLRRGISKIKANKLYGAAACKVSAMLARAGKQQDNEEIIPRKAAASSKLCLQPEAELDLGCLILHVTSNLGRCHVDTDNGITSRLI
jgi:hypothetical protein